MNEYNIITPEMLEKKISLKEHSKNTISRLKEINLIDEYGVDYVSDTGLTIYDFQDLITRLENCGNESTYTSIESIDDYGEITDNIKMVETSCCHQYSICPMCASTKRNQIIRSIRPYVAIAAQMPGIYLYMATITIRGSQSAIDDYDRLRSAWTDFNKLGQRRINGKRSSGEAGKILGSVLSIEIVHDDIEGKNFHVHGHILMITSSPLDYAIYDNHKKQVLIKKYGYGNVPDCEMEKIVLRRIDISDGEIQNNVAVSKISEEWNRVSGDINIFVAPIRERVINGKVKSIENQIFEVIKYETKPWEMDSKTLLSIWGTVKGKRRITKSGIFRNCKSAKREWLDLLELHGLKTDWLELMPDEIPDNIQRLPDVDYRVITIKYCDASRGYDQELSSRDISYLDLPEYKIYQRNRVLLINDYVQRVKRHHENYMLVSSVFSLDRSARVSWIEEKEKIKQNMRDQINILTDNLRHEIKMLHKVQRKLSYKEMIPICECEILSCL